MKGRALRWLQSSAQYIEMTVDDLLGEMKKMFSYRPNKLLLKRRFEDRRWKVGEPFSEYYHDKIILANQAAVDKDELITYMVEGIPDSRLRDQARMHRFDDLSTLFEAFEDIVLRGDPKRNVTFMQADRKGDVAKREASSLETVRCYNCSANGHYASACPKPKRQLGSCFSCGEGGHQIKDCPKRRRSREPSTSGTATTALVDTPREAAPSVDVQPSPMRARSSLDVPTRDYCVLLTETSETQYFVEALVDSGSAINVMTESTHLNCFSKYPLLRKENRVNYGGMNKSPLQIYGYVTSNIRIQLLSSHVFPIEFAVVPDSTMSYDVLIGREFMTQPGMIVHLSNTVSMKYEEPISNIMNIEPIANGVLDVVENNLDESLPVDAKNSLLNILDDYVQSKCEIEKIDYEFNIKLVEKYKPFYLTLRRLSWYERNEVQKIVDNLLERKIIRQSDSDFCSPIVLVRKKDGTLRLCVDYRALNKITIKDRHPMPLIEDQIENLSGNTYFTSLDLKDGYYHVPIAEGSIKFTSFVTPDGQYEFLKMPFGLSNAPAGFRRYTKKVFQPLLDTGNVLLYFDDIFIATGAIKENLSILREVLDIAKRHGLELKLSKCKFLKKEIEYLGYNISEHGITPNKSNAEAILNFPQPRTVKQMQSFLGLTSYFRKFVPNFAIIAKPLTDLIRRDAPFRFGVDELQSFEALRDKLVSYPILSFYNPAAVTELHTDASSHGYGGILLQKQKDERMHPVMYFSRRTTAIESRYHSYELEMMAIMYAIERFRVYVQGIHFTIVTDCNAIKLAFSKKDINQRISRWCLILQNYDYTIEHRSSDRMRHVDALSRNILIVEPLSFDQILVYKQLQDPIIKKLHKDLELGESDKFELRNGVVYRKHNRSILFYVPESMTREVIQFCHDEVGHVGLEKTVELITKTYWFPGMRAMVKEYIDNCMKCLAYSIPSGKKEGELNIYDKEVRPFDTLHIDHYGPLEKSKRGHRHIFIVIDAFSKYVIMYSVKSTTTKEVIACLRQYFLHLGLCRRIISDRGTCFTSAEFSDYLYQCKVDHVKVATATPRGNGQVERVNRFLRSVLAKLSVDETWDAVLSKAQFSINNTHHKSIDTTPSMLLFGSDQRGYADDDYRDYFRMNQDSDSDRDELRQHAGERTREMQLYNKEVYDKRRKRPRVYNIGDYVLIKNIVTTPGLSQKLLPKYKGPYVIKKVLDLNRYVISDIEGFQLSQKPFTGIVAPDNMKPWIRYTHFESDDENKDGGHGRGDHIYQDGREL